MRIGPYTITRTDKLEGAVRDDAREYLQANRIRNTVVSDLLAANHQLAAKCRAERCLWCGRTRDGALKAVEAPKGAGVAV